MCLYLVLYLNLRVISMIFYIRYTMFHVKHCFSAFSLKDNCFFNLHLQHLRMFHVKHSLFIVYCYFKTVLPISNILIYFVLFKAERSCLPAYHLFYVVSVACYILLTLLDLFSDFFTVF